MPLLCNAGFTAIRQGAFFVKPFAHRQMAGVVESRLASEQMLLGLYRMVRHTPGLGAEISVDASPSQS